MTITQEMRDDLARKLAASDGLNWDERCGYELAETDADLPHECNSSTCIAAHYEDHDPSAARANYRNWAEVALGHLAARGYINDDFLTQLRRVNAERYAAWADAGDAGIMFDAVELGGEVGELLNVVKKLEREERGWRGSRANDADFADECADVLICLDKLARRRGVDLAQACVSKFNATSEKQGFPHRLTMPGAAS